MINLQSRSSSPVTPSMRFTLTLLLTLLTTPLAAEDWPQFLGPQRDGVSRETGLSRRWPRSGPPVAWSVDSVGEGYSTVAVAGGRIYTMGDLDGIEHVMCLSVDDGQMLWSVAPDGAARRLTKRLASEWRRLDLNRNGQLEPGEWELQLPEAARYFAGRPGGRNRPLSKTDLRIFLGGFRTDVGDGPRGTPTLDGDRLYVEGGLGDVSCLDARTGRTTWHVSLVDDLGGTVPVRGYSESLLVVGRTLIVTPGGDRGTIAALDKTTGKVLWRSRGLTAPAQHASPVTARIAGVPQVVQFARGGVCGVRLRDGQLLWRFGRTSNDFANCATPVVYGSLVFSSTAYGTGGALVRIVGGDGRQRAQEVYFERRMANHHGGVIKYRDHLYGFGNGGLICMEFRTGKIAWRARSVTKGSLVVADGLVFLVGEHHRVALAEATPTRYRERGRFSLPDLGRPSWSYPVVSGGRLYIRNLQRLTAFDVREAD